MGEVSTLVCKYPAGVRGVESVEAGVLNGEKRREKGGCLSGPKSELPKV